MGLGREPYYAALTDPYSLCSNRHVESILQEELNYAAAEAYETVTGSALTKLEIVVREALLGEPWDEATVAAKYPALAAKFGFA